MPGRAARPKRRSLSSLPFSVNSIAHAIVDASPVDVFPGADSPGIDATLEQGGVIEGTVYGSDGLTALSDIYVEAFTPDGMLVATALTDVDGVYQLIGLEPGDHLLSFNTAGYNESHDARLLDEYYLDARTMDVALPVWAEPGTVTSGIDVTLEEGATLSGVVTGDAGTPLVGIEVRIRDELSGQEYYQLTGPGGVWQSRAVAPGDYVIEYNTLTYNADEGMSYVREYWNDEPTPDTADLVTVGLAETHDYLDAQLAQGGLTLTANVEPPAGVVDGICWVSLYERWPDGSEHWLTDRFWADAPAAFAFTGLTPGDYLVHAVLYGTGYNLEWAYDQKPSAPFMEAPGWADEYRMDLADAITMTTGDRADTRPTLQFSAIRVAASSRPPPTDVSSPSSVAS